MKNNWKERLQKYLPDIEEFLTSVLLEEAHVVNVTSDYVEKDTALEGLKENDIFLFTRAEAFGADVIAVLDEEWFGLLSSIMLGIEEKALNEDTLKLLKEFSEDLSATLVKKIEENGFITEVDQVQVLTFSEVQEKMGHTEYFLTKMEVEGLADNNVRAEFLLGNPEAKIKTEEEVQEETEKAESENRKADREEASKDPSDSGDDFTSVDAEEMEKMGTVEKVISGRQIEFAEFDEDLENNGNGSSHSMDLLKDVVLDLSVELGRIELPLGKVLQLSKGSVIELEKLAGEPVDILVNGHLIAHGDVVVIDEHFGVRISNLITTRKRIARLSNES